MLHFKTSKLAVFAAVCLLGVGFATAANAFAYDLTELSPLGSQSTALGTNYLGQAQYSRSLGYGMNDLGQVVGQSSNTNGPQSPTIWNGSTPSALSPGGNGAAYAINSVGQVAGSLNGSATIWNDGTPMALPFPGATSSWALGINSAGQIVGFGYGIFGIGRVEGMIWNGGSPTALQPLSGMDETIAQGINAAGLAVGQSYSFYSSAGPRAVLWNGATPIDLGTLPGGNYSIAYAINDVGQVVGASTTTMGNTASYATIWNNGTPTALGTPPNGSQSVALAINNVGQAVGFFNTEQSSHAALWENGEAIDLNSLLDESGAGWTLSEATAINASGQIAGWGLDPQGEQIGFLLNACDLCQAIPPIGPLTAIPEPSTWAMMLIGFAGLGYAGYRRAKRNSPAVAL